ncbi:hypothetical protein RYX36_030771 [Vicia faba]
MHVPSKLKSETQNHYVFPTGVLKHTCDLALETATTLDNTTPLDSQQIDDVVSPNATLPHSCVPLTMRFDKSITSWPPMSATIASPRDSHENDKKLQKNLEKSLCLCLLQEKKLETFNQKEEEKVANCLDKVAPFHALHPFSCFRDNSDEAPVFDPSSDALHPIPPPVSPCRADNPSPTSRHTAAIVHGQHAFEATL